MAIRCRGCRRHPLRAGAAAPRPIPQSAEKAQGSSRAATPPLRFSSARGLLRLSAPWSLPLGGSPRCPPLRPAFRASSLARAGHCRAVAVLAPRGGAGRSASLIAIRFAPKRAVALAALGCFAAAAANRGVQLLRISSRGERVPPCLPPIWLWAREVSITIWCG